MLTSSSVLTVAKYTFLSLVVSSAGYLIATMTVVKRHRIELLDDLVYKPQTALTSDKALLDKSFNRCLTFPTKPFCLMSANRKLSLHRLPEFHSQTTVPDSHSTVKYRRHPIATALREFSRVARSVNVRPVLLEASVLFCVLSAIAKIKLLMQGFRLHGSQSFITLGVSEEEGKVLDQKTFLMSALTSGFEVSRVRKSLADEEISTVHFFFRRQEGTIHLVVLIARQNYVWHASHDHVVLQDPVFAREAIYENFTVVPLKTEQMEFYMPSDPLSFLLQMHTSEFRKCSLPDEASFHPHATLTSDQLRKRTQVAIQEIKTLLRPHYVPFWLWSASLSGWREACNVFSATSELNLAASTLKNMNLSIALQDNLYLKYSRSDDKGRKFSLDCHGLTVNMFVADEDGNSFQGEGTESSDSRVYPKFRLCTTDVFDLRVHVPCD